MFDELPQQVVDSLRRIANGRRPTAGNWTMKMTHHELTTLARELCDKHGLDYSDKGVHGETIYSKRIPALVVSQGSLFE